MPSAIVMIATYNGIRYLGAQIKSIEYQAIDKIDLIFSDDGSRDGTVELIKDVRGSWKKGKVIVLNGPRSGFAENYRHLILSAPAQYDIFAFCDQDDVWRNDKLSTAADWLTSDQEDVPRLYCERTHIIDDEFRSIGHSPKFTRPPSFRNAIVQSIAGGNTMVYNLAAHNLLAKACRRTSFVSHDWWAYLMVSGAGGKVHYSSQPHVSYRQHSGNLVGANASWRARMHRLLLMASGRFKEWNDQNLKGLRLCEDLLTDEARSIVDNFQVARNGNITSRLIRLRQSQVYRQTVLGQISLYVACILNRI